MLAECAWYCKDTYATNFRINLQIINNEMMILICLICRYIMLHQFISSRKSKICIAYLRILSRMKAAYIFYFQYSFQEIRIINTCSMCMSQFTVQWLFTCAPRQCGGPWGSFNSFVNCWIPFISMFFICTNTCFIYPFDSCMGFPIYNIAFYRKM